MPQSPSSSSSSEAERDALLPCPFCGTAPLKDKMLGVWCANDDCSIVGQVFSGGARHWNTRATPPSLPIDFKQASEQGELLDAAEAFLEAQDALDNREYQGINGEDYGVLRGRVRAARKDLERAMRTPSPHPEEGALLLGGDEGGKKGGGE